MRQFYGFPLAFRSQARRQARARLFRQAAALACLSVSCLSVSGLVSPSPAGAQSFGASPRFRYFVQSLWPQASRMGVSRRTFDTAFAGVTPDPSVVAKTHKQSEFVRPIWDYIDSAVTPKRITKGRRELQETRGVLSRIERTYGVDPYIVLGVWGVETNFGSNLGDTSVIRDLATLAYVHYRGEYFRRELLIALEILQQGHVSAAGMKGSWAGAMGQTQFMPSAFMRYAVDFEGDGRKNIWTSAPDALASTANFLARHGWRPGWTWGYEVFPPRSPILSAGRDLPFAAWARAGFRRADGFPMPTEGRARLLLPAGRKGPAFLVTRNFDVIKRYNDSTAYALSVALLSDRIAGEGPLKQPWPDDFPTASIAR